MTRDELVELLTVERFAPWRPPAPVRKPRRRPAPARTPLVPLDDPDVVEARRRAVAEEASALWHDDADRVLDLAASPPATHERTA